MWGSSAAGKPHQSVRTLGLGRQARPPETGNSQPKTILSSMPPVLASNQRFRQWNDFFDILEGALEGGVL